MSNISLRLIGSYEKCFIDEDIDSKPEITSYTTLKGQCGGFQAAFTDADAASEGKTVVFMRITSPVSDYISIKKIVSVPSEMPVMPGSPDTNYLSRKPGLYPDLLIPADDKTELYAMPDYFSSVYIDIDVPENAAAGFFPVTVELVYRASGEVAASASLTVEIINAVLPESKLIYTQWFHCDCLADYYRVGIFSEEHWRIIESFIKTAVKNGMNMLLTPIFTPPLDTAVGHERPTVQLVDVTLEDGVYSFGFEKLKRWVALSEACGIKYFEFSHLFTQWGAKCAPKIVGQSGGEMKKLFGWETDARGDEYRAFLDAFLPALLDEIKTLGIDKRCFFHISDEPGGDMLEGYLAAKSQLAAHLSGQRIMDALSDYEFYKSGAVETPVVSTDHIKTYISAGVKPLWAYYCCCQHDGVSNRMLSMPTARTRAIGVQLYKYDIEGFLQWGYNFYYTQGSTELVNPYLCTDGGLWVPSGDAFSVYPAPDGTAYESLHMRGFTDALCDLRALRLLEEYIGREAVLEIIDSLGEEVVFEKCPRNAKFITSLMALVYEKIKQCAN